MSKEVIPFDELYLDAVDPDGLISSFITGHLMIEFMLIKLVEIDSSKLSICENKITHCSLINLASGLDLIDDKQTEVLLGINVIRNKFAENIAYRPTIEEVKRLFILAKNSFKDLNYGLIKGIAELEGKASIYECKPYIYSNLFTQIAYDLHEVYQEFSGDIIQAKKDKDTDSESESED
jgi:hypothetical protein